MERVRSKDPVSGEYYDAKSLKVGKVMTFRHHNFILIEADEYTLNFMENKKFPASDVTAIVDKLKEKFREQAVLIRDTFRRVDEDHSGSLNMSEFKQALKKFNFDVSDQELISIMRKFDPDGDGSIRYDEFCKSVLEDDYKQVEGTSGGQVLHGNNRHEEAERQKRAAEQQVVAQEHKQAALHSILERTRQQLRGQDCSEAFVQADERGDGHCSYDAFAELLYSMGLSISDEEMEIVMESFYDPDHEDQTRPMSLVVLDEALFR